MFKSLPILFLFSLSDNRTTFHPNNIKWHVHVLEQQTHNSNVMSRKLLSTLRNNWKKSIFFGCLGIYGIKYGLCRREENEMMRLRCLEALQMGQVTNEVPTRITVILNPAADAGKARRKYEDYCAPLLHLAGVKVSVVRTEGMGQAKEIMGVMKDADAVLVAGGDGTLMETVTGLLRREDAYAKSITLGVLPVGRENRLAKALFSSNADNEVDLMSSATLAALRKLFRPMDALQVSPLSNEESEKKLFGLRSLHLGAFRDVSERKNKFWYFGPLQDFFAHVFSYSTSHKEINWDLNGELELSESETLEKVTKKEEAKSPAPKSSARWPLSLLLGSSITPSKKEAISFKRIYEWASLPHYEGLELFIALTGNESLEGKESQHDLRLRLGPKSLDFSDFVSEGLSRESKASFSKELYSEYVAKAIRFLPGRMGRDSAEGGVKFSLDDESIELRGGLEVSILPNKIMMFCSKDSVFEFACEEDDAAKAQNKRKWIQSSLRPTLSGQSKLI